MKVETGIFRIKSDIHITPICLDFINRCLRYDPRKRMDWEILISHPFYNDQYYYKTLQMMSVSLEIDDTIAKFRKD